MSIDADQERAYHQDDHECICDEGKIWNNADPTSGQWVHCDCESCPFQEKVNMKEDKIAYDLLTAIHIGPYEVADIIRRTLTVLQFELERGMEPSEAIRNFQENIGLSLIPVTKTKWEKV